MILAECATGWPRCWRSGCALSAAGHNSLAVIAEWARRYGQQELGRLGCLFDPFTGRHRVHDERTLANAYAKVDPAELTAAGYGRLAALVRPEPARNAPDGVPKREQPLVYVGGNANVGRTFPAHVSGPTSTATAYP